MKKSNVRARVAIGSAVLAVAGFGVVGQLTASASAPPTSEPGSSEPSAATTPAGSEPAASEPAGSTPALDPEREALVDEIVTQAEAEGLPLDRECLAGLVAQVADADIAIIAAEMAAPPVTATGSESAAPSSAPVMASEAPIGPDTVVADTMVPDTMVPDTMAPMETTPQLSAEAEAIGEQVITCVQGDADPALAAEAMGVIAADESSPEFDLPCVERILSTFDDTTLQHIIDNGVEPMIDAVPAAAPATVAVTGSDPTGDSAPVSAPASEPVTSMEEAAFEEMFLLLACSSDITGDTAMSEETVVVSDAPAVPVSVAVTETTGS